MISVALCTCNGEKYIGKQLLSIVNQTLVPDEIVITDDCSIDNTLSIVKQYSTMYNNISWNIIANDKRLGFTNNFLKAISLAKGEYIFLSDQDDIWNKEKIEKMLIKLKSNNNIKILFSSYKCIDSNDNILRYNYRINNSFLFIILSKIFKVYKYAFTSFVKSMNVAGMSMCIKKEFVEKFLKLHIDNIKYHDLFLALLASVNQGLYFYNEPLVNYRMHADNTIGLKSAIGLREDRVNWLKYNVNNQKLMKRFLIDNKLDGIFIEYLDRAIKLNEQRISLLINKQFFKTLINVIKITLYPSILSYFGDIRYILKG